MINVSEAANKFLDILHNENKIHLTLSWPAFEKEVGRKKIREEFRDRLETELNFRSIFIAYGPMKVNIGWEQGSPDTQYERKKK